MSLDYLKHFSIFILKIDRSFTLILLIYADSSEIIVAIFAEAPSEMSTS